MQTTIPLIKVQLSLGHKADVLRADAARRKAMAMLPKGNNDLRWAVQDAIYHTAAEGALHHYRYATGSPA